MLGRYGRADAQRSFGRRDLRDASRQNIVGRFLIPGDSVGRGERLERGFGGETTEERIKGLVVRHGRTVRRLGSRGWCPKRRGRELDGRPTNANGVDGHIETRRGGRATVPRTVISKNSQLTAESSVRIQLTRFRRRRSSCSIKHQRKSEPLKR